MSRTTAAAVGAALVALVAAKARAIEPMSPQQIIALGKHAVGYSYWWGHGRFRTDGAQPGSCSGSCPGCTHTGAYGGDCSGFVAKAWQVPTPSPIDVDKHPYSTYNFTNQTTHWVNVAKNGAALADSFVYNVDGAGHIFLYESGDPWGSVKAYECKGCSYGCVYGSRKVDAKYKVIRRNALTGACKAHCEGTKIVGDDCGVGDCAAFGAGCVDDALGVRCVFSACPAVGTATVCLDDKTLGNCKNGQLEKGDCSAFAAYCSTAGGQPAHCASALCVGSPNDVPVEHDICSIDGKRYRCDASGVPIEKFCPAGTQCTAYPEVQCKAGLGCPATGKGAKICLDDRMMGECIEGGAHPTSDCDELASYCSTALGQPMCVPKVCVDSPADKPVERLVCGADGQVAHCKPDGSVDFSSCPEGTACVDGACVDGASAGGAVGAGGAGGSTSGATGGKSGAGATGQGAGPGTGGKGGSAGVSKGGSTATGAAGEGEGGSGGQPARAGKPLLITTTGDETQSGACALVEGPARGGATRALAALGVVIAGAAARRRRARQVG